MNEEIYNAKVRAGFTTFYLWLGIVINSIMVIAYFATIFIRRSHWSVYNPIFSRICGLVLSAILVYGYFSIMRWKKSGFYILVLMAGVSQVMKLLGGGSLSVATFFPIFSLLILYAVLQIRKNGKSCWEQLS